MMSPVINNQAKSRILRSHPLFPFASVLLLALLVASTFVALTHSSTRTMAQASSFTFTAAGDYSQTPYTDANLTYMKTSGAAFNLALGDFSYAQTVTSTVAAAWSSYAQGKVGASFPFEIIPGDHDAGQLATYAVHLPDHLGSSGAYAKQYYFDYPAGTSPLARFIMISPGKVSGYSYTKGSAGYNWVSSTIDQARAANIRWVIVGMYDNCFSIGSVHCSKDNILNLLVSKKVDLVLDAHKHNYQASKQLAFNGTTCTSLTTSYNANCVVNATQSIKKGQGTVIVITGTGGVTTPLSISNTDPAIPYFRAYNGAGSNTTWGVTQITISQTQLTDTFVHVTGVKGSGTFTDNFTIS